MRRILVALFLAFVMAGPTAAQEVQVDGPPFDLPFTEPPGPTTWLYQQHYGNTISAYNYGDVWYEYGQGLHFGIDFMVPCDTPVHAIADGVVAVVSAEGFGAGPHNLVLDHPGTGYASLYGHLKEMPLLIKGQTVKRGEQIGISGDPDGSCGSRPHLHLEIRTADYLEALNPLPFFDVDWHMLSSIGQETNDFQQDLDMPYRWMRIEDQPVIQFSGNILNNYLNPWPPEIEQQPAPNTLPLYELPPLDTDTTVTHTIVTDTRWSMETWWDPADPDAVYVIDAVPGNGSGVFRQSLDGTAREYVESAPPAYLSPTGDYALRALDVSTVRITRRADGVTSDVHVGSGFPSVSPGGTRLLWEIVHGEIVPGTSNPSVQIWASELDGSTSRLVYSYIGSSARWLDDDRVLIVRRIPYMSETLLYVVNLNDPTLEPQLLGSYNTLCDLQVAPGGEWIAYYTPFQDDPAASGIYVQRTVPGTQPHQLDFFGAFRWRDAYSLYTLSYGMDQSAHTLGYVDVRDGEHHTLTDAETLPIRVANGDWHVSPNGTQIVYVDPNDYGLHLLTLD